MLLGVDNGPAAEGDIGVQTNRQFVFQGLFSKGAFFIAILVAFRGQGDTPQKLKIKPSTSLFR